MCIQMAKSTISVNLDVYRLCYLNYISYINGQTIYNYIFLNYGKCSKISNTLKLRTPKIIAENIF